MFRLTQSVLVCICLIAIGLMLTSQSLAGVTDLKAAATGIWLFDEGKGTAAKDAAGQGLAGANIQIQGTRLGAVADARGNYKIARVPAGTYTV